MGLFEALAARNIIENLKENGGVGYTETVKEQIVFNGDTDGKVVIPGSEISFYEANYVMVSDKAFSAEELSGITFVRNGEKVRYDKSEVRISDGNGIVSIDLDGYSYVIFIDESASATYGIDVGVYFAMSIDGSWYVAEVSTETKTIHPIDPKYLSKVVDLNTFSTTDGIPFSLELMSLAVGSAQAGGTLQTKTVHDSGNALRTACSTDRHLLIVAGSGSADMTFPVGAGIQDGKATCVTFIGLTIIGTVSCELKAILQFNSYTDEVDLYVKATPLA